MTKYLGGPAHGKTVPEELEKLPEIRYIEKEGGSGSSGLPPERSVEHRYLRYRYWIPGRSPNPYGYFFLHDTILPHEVEFECWGEPILSKDGRREVTE